MARITEYPLTGNAIVRGDPLTIAVRIKIDGQPQDVSGWLWRAQIRRSYDAALLDQFTIDVDTPPDEVVPNRVLLSLDTFQTSKLKTGYMFDLEQLVDQATPETWRTWWICTKLHVQKDVSHT
jgi:hypothetical protein